MARRSSGADSPRASRGPERWDDPGSGAGPGRCRKPSGGGRGTGNLPSDLRCSPGWRKVPNARGSSMSEKFPKALETNYSRSL